MNPRPSEDKPQSTLYSAKLGRVGGSRWGWVLRMKFRDTHKHCGHAITQK